MVEWFYERAAQKRALLPILARQSQSKGFFAGVDRSLAKHRCRNAFICWVQYAGMRLPINQADIDAKRQNFPSIAVKLLQLRVSYLY